MKRPSFAVFFLLSIFLLVGLMGCDFLSGLLGGSGTVALHLSDAPIDASNVTGVYITVNEIQYNQNDSWVTMEGFTGPQKYNLLELTGGETALLGNLSLPSGHYSQIRFMLDVPEQGGQTPSNPGCYIQYSDSTQQPLFVPSGGQSGYKATGAFDVPVNGTVEITADFDVRKAVVVAGSSGKYILKPTIRLIVNNEAGKMSGSITNGSSYSNITVYAYEDGTWTDTEDDDPSADSPRFPGAISSATADDAGSYVIAFLAAGTYDLVVTGTDGDVFKEVLGFKADVTVEAATKATSTNIDTDSLDGSL